MTKEQLGDSPATKPRLACFRGESGGLGLDAGSILTQGPGAIGPRNSAARLYGDMSIALDAGPASYCCRRLPSRGLLDWSHATVQIDGLVGGFGPPYPPAYTYYGESKIDVLIAEPTPNSRKYVGRIFGRLVTVDRHVGGCIDVLSEDGIVQFRSVGLAGTTVAPDQIMRSTADTLTPSPSGAIGSI